jgi:Bacterial PH domain
MNPTFASVLQWVIWGIVMSAIVGWLAKSRLKARRDANSRHLAHPGSTLLIGLVGFLFFASLAILSVVFSEGPKTWLATATFVGFAFLSLPILADYIRARHDVSEEGLSYGRMFGRRGYLKWSDLRRVKYTQSMKWFRLETQSGDVARISALLTGLPQFACFLLEYAPTEAIDIKTIPVLEATATGNPPPLWH